MQNKKKDIILGTALWGWGIEKKMAFEILDNFVENNYLTIDVATNYPISGNEQQYGQSIDWLREWKNFNQEIKLNIICKIGSLENTKTPACRLNKSFLYLSKEIILQKLQDSLSCIMVHWDNRSDKKDICETIEFFEDAYNEGFKIGLSGIKYPKIYFENSKKLLDKWIIQIKENILNNKMRKCYQEYFPNCHYQAYGINLGGIKLSNTEVCISTKVRGINIPNSIKEEIMCIFEKNSINPMPNSIYDFLLGSIYLKEDISSLIISPSNTTQLSKSIGYIRKIEKNNDYF